MLSNGNFHIPALALAFDSARPRARADRDACASRAASGCTRRRFSDLPLQLTTLGPEHSGFATIQKTLTALYNQIRHLANPASLDSLPVSESVEDHAPMAANVVAKTAAMVPLLRYLAAIELLTAAQAVDLRKLEPATLGRGAARGLRCGARACRRCSTRTVRSAPTSRRSRAMIAGGRSRRCSDLLSADEVGRSTTGTRSWSRCTSTSSSSPPRSRSRSRSSLAVGIGPRAATACSDGRSRYRGFLYTIPTLAFLALLIPVVGLGTRQRDHLHGRVLADDPHPQRRHRHSRSARRRRRRGARHGHERRSRSCGGSSCRSPRRSSSPACASPRSR